MDGGEVLLDHYFVLMHMLQALFVSALFLMGAYCFNYFFPDKKEALARSVRQYLSPDGQYKKKKSE